MRNVSNEFAQATKESSSFLKFADITLADNTQLHLTNSNLWNNGMRFEDATSSNSTFDIGSAVVNKLTLTINNMYDDFTDYVFDGAKVVAYIGKELSNGTEKVRICTATVVESPQQNSSIITLTCYDNMYKFDKDYSASNLQYPATVGAIMRDACQVCLGSASMLVKQPFDHDDYIIPSRPNDEGLTFRQVIAWAAQITGNYCRCDEYGRLHLKWYKSFTTEEILAIRDENGEPVLDENGSGIYVYESSKNESGELEITEVGAKTSFEKFTLNLDDVVITGVSVTECDEYITEGGTASTYLYGTEGYVLEIKNNKLIQEDMAETIAAMVGERVVGMRFRPFSASIFTNPVLECGDSAIVYDRKGNMYQSHITSCTIQPGAIQTIACNAQAAARQSAKQYSLIEQTSALIKGRVARKMEAFEQRLAGFAQTLSASSGLYTTEETQEDGSTIYIMHDKPSMRESSNLWKLTADAWGISADGGNTWYGIDVSANAIMNIIEARGVSADWVTSGRIEIKDEENKAIFVADIDTGEVSINADVVMIGTKTLDNELQELRNSIASAGGLTMLLSNDYQTVKVNSSGRYTNFPQVETTVQVVFGKDDVTSDCTLSYVISEYMTGSMTGNVFTCTGITADNAWVDITAEYDTYRVTKRFTVAKLYAGDTGATGVGVSGVTNYYLASSSASGVTASTSGWTQEPQTTSASKRYLWNFERVQYSDNSTVDTAPCVIGVYGETGDDGVGITEIEEYYAVSESNSVEPTSWSTTVPTMTATNKYLWNYETVTYSDGATESTKKRVIGAYGDKGEDAVTYKIEPDVQTVYYTPSGSASPAAMTADMYEYVGGEATAYVCYWALYASVDGGSNWTDVSGTGINGTTSHSSKVTLYNLKKLAATYNILRLKAYEDEAMTVLLDYEDISFVTDTQKLGIEDIFGILTADGWQGLAEIDGNYYINAAVIGAQLIKADQIDVTDLFAQAITATNFNAYGRFMVGTRYGTNNWIFTLLNSYGLCLYQANTEYKDMDVIISNGKLVGGISAYTYAPSSSSYSLKRTGIFVHNPSGSSDSELDFIALAKSADLTTAGKIGLLYCTYVNESGTSSYSINGVSLSASNLSTDPLNALVNMAFWKVVRHRGTVYDSSGSAITSDRNAKSDIVTIDSELMKSFVNLLPAVSFKYNDGTSGRRHYGFIAQDVEEVMQQLDIASEDFAGLVIEEQEDGKHYYLRYDEFEPILWSVTQNLINKVGKLESEVAELKAKDAAREAQISELIALVESMRE